MLFDVAIAVMDVICAIWFAVTVRLFDRFLMCGAWFTYWTLARPFRYLQLKWTYADTTRAQRLGHL